MPSTRTLIRALLVALLIPVLWFLAPLQLHGHTGYAIVDGISMQPKLHKGDLVVLSETSSYKVGDVVAYHNKTLGVVVLHRIKRITSDGHYIFRGDNNDFDDGAPYPTTHDLIGAKWGRIPQVGKAMLWIRDPLHAIVIGAVALLLGLTAPTPRRRGTSGPGEHQQVRRRAPATQVQLVAAIGVALAAGLWIIALGTPPTKSAVDSELYRQQAIYGWSGTARAGSVYPHGRITSGEPIFTHLVRTLDVNLHLTLTGKDHVRARGTAQLMLDISGDNGWHTLRPLGPKQDVDGATVDLTAPLDVAGLGRIARAVDLETGAASRAYTVTIIPRIALTGSVGRIPIQTTFSQGLRFRLDDTRLLPTASTATETNTLVRSVAGAGVISARNDFHFGPASVGVHKARLMGGWATVLALLGLLAATLYGRSRRAQNEPARLAWQYRDWLIPIRQLPHTAGTVTDVRDFEALVGLAERHNKAIMHLDDERGAHTYLLQENGVLYRYTALETAAGAATAVSGPATVAPR